MVATTGPQASSNSQGATVAPAWADYVNKQLGGIQGHPVQVIVRDEGSDPAKAQAAGVGFANDKGVIGLVVAEDSVLSTYATDAVKSSLPVVSGTANTAPWYSTPGLFPTTTDVMSGVTAQVDVAKNQGHAKVFAQVYCAEIAQCAQSNPIMQSRAAKDGLGFTSISVSATSTSYTAQCLSLQSRKADYVQLNIASSVGAKFIADCQQQGYNPTWGTSEQAIGPDLLGANGVTAYGPAFAFPSVADAPPVETFRTAMKDYAKGSNWREGTASYTWQGLEIIREALSAPKTPLTRAGLQSGLYALKDETLGGLLANKLTFTKGKAVSYGSLPCYFLVGIKDGKTIAPQGLTPICVTAAG
jgi:branched-chain amino acid transport system substrate-binding protein